MHRRQPGSSKSPTFIAICHFIGEMILIDLCYRFSMHPNFSHSCSLRIPKEFPIWSPYQIKSYFLCIPLNHQSQSQSKTTELNKEGRGGLDLHRKRRMMTDGARWLARSKLFLSSASSPCDKGCQNVAFFCDQKPGSEAPCFPTTKTHPITPQILLIGITPGTLGHNVHCQFRCLVNRPEVHTIMIVASLL